MFKMLTNGHQPTASNLPAVRLEPPPPAANEERTKFIGPAKRAVTVMLSSFNAGPAQAEGDLVARIEGLALVCGDYPNEVVERAALSMLTNNPNNPFPPTCQDLHARCREMYNTWKQQAWRWLWGDGHINPWNTKPCSVELLDACVMEAIATGEFWYETDCGSPGRWFWQGSELRWFHPSSHHITDKFFPRWERLLRTAGKYDEVVALREKGKADWAAELERIEKLREEERRRQEEEARQRDAEKKAALQAYLKRREAMASANSHDHELAAF